MDAVPFITEMLSLPALRDFLSKNVPGDMNNLDLIVTELIKVQILMRSATSGELPEDEKQALIDSVRITAHKVGNFVSEIVGFASRKECSSSGSHDLVKGWKETLDLIFGIVFLRYGKNRVHQQDKGKPLELKEIGAIIISLNDIKISENMLLETGDSSNFIKLFSQKTKNFKTLDDEEYWLNDDDEEYYCLNEEQSQALLLMKAFPALGELKESSKLHNFLLDISKELDDLPPLICKSCKEQPLAHLLIGSLLSLKQMAYDTWHRVEKDLAGKIEFSDNHMLDIFTYCYNDLPYFLKPCFLYFACYPIGHEIPSTSLIEIWIAEGFVIPEKGETVEETANKYLKQLVQRSLVCVSKRSFSGTIKSYRVPRIIHQFAIIQLQTDGFLVANPEQEEIESLFRLAIHHDNKKQYTKVKNNHMHSFLAFNFDSDVLGSVAFLRVLELRNSAIPVTALPNMTYLRYLGLKGSKISELPENIGDMENLQTLDVRDTGIKTLPESLWNISALRHVYVKHSPQIKGPPSTANISDLQILKTVAAHESWVENIPRFVSQLQKLALSNWDNLDWKFISNLLSHVDKLISMTIMGNIVPSESVDTRAFPKLETVKSIKLEGKWSFWRLPIDNVKFPLKLTKLTLTKSSLREDPMPTLERLQALKFLGLRDEAYTGMKMVCSAKGFPQLQFLELSKLENLVIWEVEPTAMPRLSRLRVDQCSKLNDLPNLHCVIFNDIDN